MTCVEHGMDVMARVCRISSADAVSGTCLRTRVFSRSAPPAGVVPDLTRTQGEGAVRLRVVPAPLWLAAGRPITDPVHGQDLPFSRVEAARPGKGLNRGATAADMTL